MIKPPPAAPPRINWSATSAGPEISRVKIVGDIIIAPAKTRSANSDNTVVTLFMKL